MEYQAGTRDPLVISSWSAVSPYGIGTTSFANGVRAGRPASIAAVPAEWDGPEPHAYLVPEFDAVAELGPRNTRALDRVTALAICTVRELLADKAWDASAEHDRTAFVLGTTNGSSQSMMQTTRRSMVEAKPFYIEAATVPSGVMNCAASRCAMWYQITGPNATLAAGRAAGITALGYARRLLLTGRADQVLCGAAEEYSRARAWLEHHAEEGPRAPLGEGCALFEVELASAATRRGVRPMAELLSVQFRVSSNGGGSAALLECVRDALDRAGASQGDVWAAVASGSREVADLRRLFPAAVVGRVPVTEQVGDASAASGAFALAALLAASAGNPDANGQLAIVTAVDATGSIGCATVRLLAHDR